MTKELEAALRAYEALIAAELQSDKLGRFDRIRRFCIQAATLERMTAVRVGDVARADINFMNGGEYHVEGENIDAAMPMVRGQPADSIDLVRELIGVIQPMIEDQKSAAKSRATTARLGVLNASLDAARFIGVPTANIEHEIRQILNGDDHAVDGAKLLRGCTTDQEGRVGNAGDGGEGHHQGNNGAPEAPCEGEEEGLAPGERGYTPLGG